MTDEIVIMVSIPVERSGDHGVARADGGPRGSRQTAPAGAEETVAQEGSQGGPASLGRPEVFRGDPVDSLDGGPMERIAPAVWLQERGPSALTDVDGRRHPGAALAGAPGATARAGTGALGRVLRGWDLRQRQKRGLLVGKTTRGKGTKLVVLVDGQGTPLGLHVDSASPSEVRLLVQTLETVRGTRPHQRGRPRTRPERLIADKGYDSNAVRETLHNRGITPIVPARSNNTVATHQAGRVLRRYRRRWMVERPISWLQNFRRLTTRWDRSAEVYTALAHMACALVVMKRVLG